MRLNDKKRFFIKIKIASNIINLRQNKDFKMTIYEKQKTLLKCDISCILKEF